MSKQNFNDYCSPFDPYSRAKLGWIDPIVVLDSLSDTAITDYMSTGAVYELEHKPSEYFLISNQRREYLTSRWEIGFPGRGLLIWHIDETGNNWLSLPHKLVDVEAADGLWDSIETDHRVRNDSTGQDSTDIGKIGFYRSFFNNTTKQAFSDTSNPTTDGYTYDSQPGMWKQTIISGISVNDIQGAGGGTMWADFWTPHIWWGPDTVYLSGDFVVKPGRKLHILPGTVVKFATTDDQQGGSDPSKCELIVQGTLEAWGTQQDSIYFVSASSTPSDSDWYGIRVDIGATAKLEYCNLEHAYHAIRYFNSVSDNVTHCRFRNNFMHGIRTENSSLVVKDCIIEKNWVGKDSSMGFGILSYGANCIIESTFFQGMKYGIKVEPKVRFIQPTTLIEECGFFNIGNTGILSSSSNPPIKKCCFKGTYGQNCIQVDKGNPYIIQCYMASQYDSIPIGMLFTQGATGKVRKTTIWDYDSFAVRIDNTSNPDFGHSDSVACNWFEKPDAGEYYFISLNNSDSIQARWNHWEDDSLLRIQGHISGKVAIAPILGKCEVCYPPDVVLCSDLPPSYPEFNYCKIAVRDEQRTPRPFLLSQNYPNPFNPVTVIKYDLPEFCHVKVSIYNILGQNVRTLLDDDQVPGCKTTFWDGKDGQGKEVASGIYFYRIKAGNFEEVKRMILLR